MYEPKSGLLGSYIFQFLADVLSSTGAYLVYVAGIVIGLIVLFDTSVDEIFAILAGIKDTISRLIPSGAFSFLKTKKTKSLTIKGMNQQPNYSKASPAVNATRPADKKEVPIMPDTLVTNTLGKTRIWEYPPLTLLSEVSGQKADRGDVKKTSATIDSTLQSLIISPKVVEVNLGPAVTQYALNIAQGTKVSKI